MANQNEKTIYELFCISIWLKIIGSAGEMIAGSLIALIPSTYVLHVALFLTQGDTGGEADDFFARELMTLAHTFAISNDLLIGVYIFVRGFIQFLLSLALLRNKLWAYPLLVLILVILVGTQLWAISLSQSIATAALTLVDIITIYLVWHEYAIARGSRF